MEASSETPVSPQPRNIEVGRVIGEAFSIYGANLVPLLGVGIGIAVLFGIPIGILNEEGGVILSFLGTILQLIATAIYTGFVVKLVQDVRDGRRDSSAGELISAAMPAIGGLIIFSILAGIGIAIGFVLLIIPGLYLLTIWSVGAPAIVAERKGAFEAFSRSHELVKGNGWNVFGVIVCVFLILLATTIVTAAIAAAIGGVVGAIIVAIILLVLYLPVQAIVQSVLFFDLGGGSAVAAGDQRAVVGR